MAPFAVHLDSRTTAGEGDGPPPPATPGFEEQQADGDSIWVGAWESAHSAGSFCAGLRGRGGGGAQAVPASRFEIRLSWSELKMGLWCVVSQGGPGCPGTGPKVRVGTAGGTQASREMCVPNEQVCREHTHTITITLIYAASVLLVQLIHRLPHEASKKDERSSESNPGLLSLLWVCGYLLAGPLWGRWNAGLQQPVCCYLHPDFLSGPCCLHRTCQGVLSGGYHSTGWGPLGLAFVSGAGPGAWQEAWTCLGRWAPHW